MPQLSITSRRQVLVALALATIGVVSVSEAGACPDLLSERFLTLQGEERDLCAYRGKVLLVVNTASYCGFTRQYKDLQALYERFGDQGLVILGFPSNDFGRQEPGSNAEVAQFCERNFGVRFPMFNKGGVAREGENALFDKLAQLTGERPKWNFHKYLIDRGAVKAKSYASHVEPGEAGLVKQIETWLAE